MSEPLPIHNSKPSLSLYLYEHPDVGKPKNTNHINKLLTPDDHKIIDINELIISQRSNVNTEIKKWVEASEKGRNHVLTFILNNDFPQVQNRIAVMLIKGQSPFSLKNYAWAGLLLYRASQLQLAKAQYNFALMHKEKRLGYSTKKQAVEWCYQAAKQNHSKALLTLKKWSKQTTFPIAQLAKNALGKLPPSIGANKNKSTAHSQTANLYNLSNESNEDEEKRSFLKRHTIGVTFQASRSKENGKMIRHATMSSYDCSRKNVQSDKRGTPDETKQIDSWFTNFPNLTKDAQKKSISDAKNKWVHHPNALYYFYLIYKEKDNKIAKIQTNDKAAHYWLQKAANSNHIKAHYKYAQWCEIQRKYDEACQHYCAAAKKQCSVGADAWYNLGLLYWEGLIKSKQNTNTQAAKKCFTCALDYNPYHKHAKKALQKLE